MIQVEMTNQKTYLIDYDDIDDFATTIISMSSTGFKFLRVSEHGHNEKELYINICEIVAIRKIDEVENQRQVLCE